MKIHLTFKKPTSRDEALRYEQRIWNLQRDYPDFFGESIYVDCGEDPDSEFAFFEELLNTSSLPRFREVIITRIEARSNSAPKVSYLVTEKCLAPGLTVKRIDQFLLRKEQERAERLASSNTTSTIAEFTEDDGDGETGSDEDMSAGVGTSVESLAMKDGTALCVTLFQADKLKDLIQRELGKAPDEQKRLGDYRSMEKAGPQRFLKKAPSLEALDALGQRFPNFAPALQIIRGAAALSRLADGPFAFPPMLLLGDPGIGKTYFATELAQLVGVDYAIVNMENVQAAWVLTGTHNSWSSASIGRVGECLIRAEVANPLFVIDEVDKAMEGNYNPLAPLYSLLEPQTASKFREEFLGLELDASHANWILTANDPKCIPEPLTSRMTVVEVRKPTPEESYQIAAQIYADVLAGASWGNKFEDSPSEALIESLSAHPPRTMRSVLLAGFGIAAISGRTHVEPRDLMATSPVKTTIGFTYEQA